MQKLKMKQKTRAESKTSALFACEDLGSRNTGKKEFKREIGESQREIYQGFSGIMKGEKERGKERIKKG